MLEERSFDTGVVTINYGEGPASGPPMVLLHGGSGRWQGWGPVIPALVDRWHLYAPDFRGHGKSGWVPDHYRLTDYAADMVAFLEHSVGEPAVLWGHSLGAMVALMVAAERPELVRAVINSDAPLQLDASREALTRTRPMVRGWRALVGTGCSVEEIAAALREVPVPVPGEDRLARTADVWGEESPWYQWMAENLQRHDPTMLDAVIEFEAMHAGYDSELLLPRITCPMMLLQGDPAAGGMLTEREVARAKELHPRVESALFAGIGHPLHTTHPEPVLRVVTPFLESLEPVGDSQ
jgi:pimeloyl-ACP methyl ester carboxylesterase